VDKLERSKGDPSRRRVTPSRIVDSFGLRAVPLGNVRVGRRTSELSQGLAVIDTHYRGPGFGRSARRFRIRRVLEMRMAPCRFRVSQPPSLAHLNPRARRVELP